MLTYKFIFMEWKYYNDLNYYPSYKSKDVNYTTAEWSEGSGGFSYTIKDTGLYYVKATFYGVSGTMTAYHFGLKCAQNGSTTIVASSGFGNTKWSGTMPVEEIDTILPVEAGAKFYPYVHTPTVGVVVGTRFWWVKIK